MNIKILLPTLALLVGSEFIFAEKLTVERLYSSPSLSGEAVRNLKISPDGQRITFLKGKDTDYERLDLWEYNVDSAKTQILFDSDDLHAGREILSDEEKARRERQRLKGSGIVDYQWSSDGKALLFPLAGDVYYWKVGEQKARKILATPEFETDVQFSPKGNYISYIRNQNLFVMNLHNNREMQLTKAGGGPVKMGMAEFVAQEEMDRMTGYWWAPDESKLAFTKVDESPVEQVTRSEIYADEVKMIQQRYPFAGNNNVLIELGIVQLADNTVKWVDLGKNNDIYIPRVKWTKDSNVLSFQWQSRDQQHLKLQTVSWPSMRQKTLLEEKSDTWVNLHDELRFLNNKTQLIWASERDGFKHLYLYSMKGKEIRQLTRGDWVVDNLEKVDEKRGKIYFTGRKDTPLERHLYSVPIGGGKIEKISRRSGFHSVVFGDDNRLYIDKFSTAQTPDQLSLHSANGDRVAWLAKNEINAKHPLHPYHSDWIAPEFGTFETDDKATLYYRLYKPADFDASRKYPVLVYLYGGPGVQLVTNRWGNLFPQYMAQQGYAVFTLDNRGSNYRGKAFEDPIYKAMGDIEIRDQVAGVKFLRQFSWVDRERIGIHGHSYGGYMTLMAMFKAPDYFKAGVAGSPATDWTLYDTHYTERYMGNPQKDAEAYEKSSVFSYATNLQGPLLIYHGMADDNVLFKNSTRLYSLLQKNNIPFYVMDYPGKKHSIRGKQTQMHRLNMIRNFFDLHFGVKR